MAAKRSLIAALVVVLAANVAYADDPLPPAPRSIGATYNRYFAPHKLPLALPSEMIVPTTETPGILRVRPETMYGDYARALRAPGGISAIADLENGWRVLRYDTTGGDVASMLRYAEPGTEVYNYVIDPDGVVRIGRPLSDGARSPHPTLIGGDAHSIQARGAGQVLVRNGKVVAVDLMSGHFKPTPEFIPQTVDAFSKLPPSLLEDGRPPVMLRDVVFDKTPVVAPELPKPSVKTPLTILEPPRAIVEGAPPPCMAAQAPPSMGTLARGQVGPGLLVVAGTVAGKVTEHETGSPAAGLAVGGTVVVAPLVIKHGWKGAGTAVAPALAGAAVRYGTQEVTGSETAGDLAGFGAAAGTGAYFGAAAGPPGAAVGAISGVVIHGTSELAGAGVDYYYANRRGHALEEYRQITNIHSVYVHALGREPSPSELASWKKRFEAGMNIDGMARSLANSAEAMSLADRVYQSHRGRSATAAERSQWRRQIAGHWWAEDLELELMATRAMPATP